jgi:hypothetical protein
MLTILAIGVLLLAAIVAWQRTTIHRQESDLAEERAAAAFAHGIRDVAAHHDASAWDADVGCIEVTR